MYNQN